MLTSSSGTSISVKDKLCLQTSHVSDNFVVYRGLTKDDIFNNHRISSLTVFLQCKTGNYPMYLLFGQQQNKHLVKITVDVHSKKQMISHLLKGRSKEMVWLPFIFNIQNLKKPPYYPWQGVDKHYT